VPRRSKDPEHVRRSATGLPFKEPAVDKSWGTVLNYSYSDQGKRTEWPIC
jgi:hypothetical protein